MICPSARLQYHKLRSWKKIIGNIFDCHLYLNVSLCMMEYHIYNSSFQLFFVTFCFFASPSCQWERFFSSIFFSWSLWKKRQNFLTMDVIWYILSLSVCILNVFGLSDPADSVRFHYHPMYLIRCVFHHRPMVNMMKIPIEWRYGSS